MTRVCASLLQGHVRNHPSKHYIVDSTCVKNAFGRVGLGRNPVDRGRKALKISALTDQDGIVHNLRCDPANTSDFRLFTPISASSMLIDLRRIEVFADRGYDSRRNRDDAYQRGFLPRVVRRRCRNSRRQNGKRVRIEYTFGWIDKSRRLLFQYEQTEQIQTSLSLTRYSRWDTPLKCSLWRTPVVVKIKSNQDSHMSTVEISDTVTLSSYGRRRFVQNVCTVLYGPFSSTKGINDLSKTPWCACTVSSELRASSSSCTSIVASIVA